MKRWLLIAVLAGCGGAAVDYCPDACSGAKSVKIETGYYAVCGGQVCPKPTLVCTCAAGGQPLQFIEPESVVACTTLRGVWADWQARGCRP